MFRSQKRTITSAPNETGVGGEGQGSGSRVGDDSMDAVTAVNPLRKVTEQVVERTEDVLKFYDGSIVDVRYYPPGYAIPRPNPSPFVTKNACCLCIPAGEHRVSTSDTDIELYRMSGLFNWTCWAARVGEHTHWSSVKLLRHSRSARSCRALCKYLLLSIAAGVSAAYIAFARVQVTTWDAWLAWLPVLFSSSAWQPTGFSTARRTCRTARVAPKACL